MEKLITASTLPASHARSARARRPSCPWRPARPGRPTRPRRRPGRSRAPRTVWLAGAAVLLAGGLWWASSRGERPLDLAYTVDVAEAAAGRLTVTLALGGTVPRTVALGRPAGLCGGAAGRPPVTELAAWNHTQDGGRGAPLPWRADGDRWLVDASSAGGAAGPAAALPWGGPAAGDAGGDGDVRGAGGERNAALARPAASVRYTVTLPPPPAGGADIRGHISVAVPGGWRAGAFHLFLVPEGTATRAVAVRFVDASRPGGAGAGRLAAPWPAGGTADGVIYRPAGLDDLANALVAGGDLRLREEDAGGCTLRIALRGAWDFPDAELGRLLRRLAAAEVAFFGGAPRPSALILVEPNPLPAAAGFDDLGLHAGSSVLLLLEPRTAWSDLADKTASVAAHELFHGWLGEAIRPAGSDLAWFVEGATAWYTARLLVETGIWTADRAEGVVGARIDQHYARSALLGRETVAGAAADLLRDGQTTRFAYAGGCLAAASLDAWLAGEGAGTRHPLDAVLRDLYARRAEGPLDRAALEAALRRAAGRDGGPWLDRFVYGKEALRRPVPMF